jgi:hypothetical protein
MSSHFNEDTIYQYRRPYVFRNRTPAPSVLWDELDHGSQFN